MSCCVGHRCGLDSALLWLWMWPAAAAPILPLTWELPYAVGDALKRPKKKKKKKFLHTEHWNMCSMKSQCCKYSASEISLNQWWHLSSILHIDNRLKQYQHQPQAITLNSMIIGPTEVAYSCVFLKMETKNIWNNKETEDILENFPHDFFLFVSLGPQVWHMEVPRLGVKSKL